MAETSNATLKITCRSLSQGYQPVLPVRLQLARSCENCQNHFGTLPKIWWTKECQHHGTHKRESDWELRRKVVSKKHSISTHFPKDRNCEGCEGTLARNALPMQYFEHGIIVHQRLTVLRRMVFLGKRYAEWLVPVCCRLAVKKRSGGRIPWNVTVF